MKAKPCAFWMGQPVHQCERMPAEHVDVLYLFHIGEPVPDWAPKHNYVRYNDAATARVPRCLNRT